MAADTKLWHLIENHMQNRRVLVIDDNQSTSLKIARCLNHLKVDFSTVEKLADADALLRKEQFDLVLCTAHLETEDSLSLLKQFHYNRDGGRLMRIVYFSAQQTPKAQAISSTVAKVTRTLGADDFISMHEFDPDQFSRQIAALLGDDSDDLLFDDLE